MRDPLLSVLLDIRHARVNFFWQRSPMALDSFVSGFSRISRDLDGALSAVFRKLRAGMRRDSTVASLIRYSQVVMPNPETAFDWVLDMLIDHISTEGAANRSRGTAARFVSAYETGARKPFLASSSQGDRDETVVESTYDATIGSVVEYSLSIDRIFDHACQSAAFRSAVIPSVQDLRLFLLGYLSACGVCDFEVDHCWRDMNMFNDSVVTYFGYSQVTPPPTWDRLIELHHFSGRERTVKGAASSFKIWRQLVFGLESNVLVDSREVGQEYYELVNRQRAFIQSSAVPTSKSPFRRVNDPSRPDVSR